MGPRPVAVLDPFRIVAVLGGQPYTSQSAFILFGFVPPATSKEYGPQLKDILEQIYLHAAVAYEALQLHLELLQPWMNQLRLYGISPHGTTAAQVLAQTGNVLRAPGSSPTYDVKNEWEYGDALSNPTNWLDKQTIVARARAVVYGPTVEILWSSP